MSARPVRAKSQVPGASNQEGDRCAMGRIRATLAYPSRAWQRRSTFSDRTDLFRALPAWQPAPQHGCSDERKCGKERWHLITPQRIM